MGEKSPKIIAGVGFEPTIFTRKTQMCFSPGYGPGKDSKLLYPAVMIKELHSFIKVLIKRINNIYITKQFNIYDGKKEASEKR